MPFPEINPPLVNSANPWATIEEQLSELYDCPYTGAVTTRTATLTGFAHDAEKHGWTFFDARSHTSSNAEEGRSSLNTLGYSPHDLSYYVDAIQRLIKNTAAASSKPKPFIVSVTGTPLEVGECFRRIRETASRLQNSATLLMEVNLSCPNIEGAPPPAFNEEAIKAYHVEIENGLDGQHPDSLPWGLKTPPFTHDNQFATVVDAITQHRLGGGRLLPTFITATNTLGGCLLLDAEQKPALGNVGGMAGEALHPLALGNVRTFRSHLNRNGNPEIRNIRIIGTGGVADAAGAERMLRVGADVVGVGTALGREGTGVFEKIGPGLKA